MNQTDEVCANLTDKSWPTGRGAAFRYSAGTYEVTRGKTGDLLLEARVTMRNAGRPRQPAPVALANA